MKKRRAKTKGQDHCFEKLLVLGRKKGHLTYEEINNYLPDEIISADEIERVFAILDNEKIEIVDSEEEFKARHKQDGGNGKHKVASNKQKLAPSLEGAQVGIEDPVKMYLRQMGQIPLLSRENELRLAQEIEASEGEYKRSVISCPYIKEIVLSLVNNFRKKII